MRQKTKFITFLLMIAALAFACNSKQNTQGTSASDNANGNHKIVVKEVLQATSYTYLKADQDGKDVWIAINKEEIPVGETLYYKDGLEMHDFKSNDLDRTFETVYFVQHISKVPIIPDVQPQSVMGSTEAKKPVLSRVEVEVEKPEGGVTIGDLYADPEKYADKSITIRGKVIKVNPAIMNRNWIHLQDGTGDEVNFDLTVTTNDVPEVGDIVTYEGKIGLKRDFGMGYAYDVLLEDAKRVDQ